MKRATAKDLVGGLGLPSLIGCLSSDWLAVLQREMGTPITGTWNAGLREALYKRFPHLVDSALTPEAIFEALLLEGETSETVTFAEAMAHLQAGNMVKCRRFDGFYVYKVVGGSPCYKTRDGKWEPSYLSFDNLLRDSNKWELL